MSIRKLPGTPIPFIKKARNTGGSMGTEGAICLIVLMLLLFVASGYIMNLMEDFVFPDIGIPYPTLFTILFIIIIVGVILVTVVSLIKDGIVQGSNSRSRERDPSICKRVIKDGIDGMEFIVSGDKETTFGQACKNHWQFESVSRTSGWYIKDSRGNDVTDMSLFSFDGICTLFPEYGTEKKKKDSDESFYSIHDSVTYYD